MSIATDHSDAAILTRVIKPAKKDLPPSAARAILKLEFDASDRQRMHELAEKNQAGTPSAEEQADLEAYLSVGLLLDLLRAKAELSLEGAANGR
jgi:hypothetical protein